MIIIRGSADNVVNILLEILLGIVNRVIETLLSKVE